ncbi:helix-turn-helix domain-containing protein [Aquimarina algiphila]|uniref:helix-turn-helix domain-containing protein n=1 Tax=Aquimarina algiphila TaxID=2047982 RepID=UPI00232E97A6|nr:helix-turn-helix domain-containing protein [Aquimarina algiphila]
MTKQEAIEANLKALLIFSANDAMLTVDECASYLKKHRNTVTRLIHEKQIKAKLVGGHWIIPKLQFLDYLLEDLEN